MCIRITSDINYLTLLINTKYPTDVLDRKVKSAFLREYSEWSEENL